ncbi:hypothetical protein CHUAL_001417 [Chamberlinius hualienensis]
MRSKWHFRHWSLNCTSSGTNGTANFRGKTRVSFCSRDCHCIWKKGACRCAWTPAGNQYHGVRHDHWKKYNQTSNLWKNSTIILPPRIRTSNHEKRHNQTLNHLNKLNKTSPHGNKHHTSNLHFWPWQ